MRLKIPNHHIVPPLPHAVGGSKHGVRFPEARRISQKYFQAPPILDLFFFPIFSQGFLQRQPFLSHLALPLMQALVHVVFMNLMNLSSYKMIH